MMTLSHFIKERPEGSASDEDDSIAFVISLPAPLQIQTI